MFLNDFPFHDTAQATPVDSCMFVLLCSMGFKLL
jgi:hypothetical protein